MIAMTSGTTGNAHLHEYLAVATLVEQLRVHRVALTADVDHRGDSRRRSAMIAVTVVAGRRRQIAFNRDHFPVHALFVLLDLVGRDFIRCHVFFVGVTSTAGIGDVGRMNRRTRIVGRADRMRFMTTGASRDFLILLFSQSPAMNRGGVFRNLVHAQ